MPDLDQNLDQKIHDFVLGCEHPVNVLQVFEGLKNAGEKVKLQEVRDAMTRLREKGLLVDAQLPSYFAVC